MNFLLSFRVAAIMGVCLVGIGVALRAQSGKTQVPLKISWTPHFGQGTVDLTITNTGDMPVRILPSLSYFCVQHGHMPRPSSGAEEDDVYSPTVLFIGKSENADLPLSNPVGLVDRPVVIDVGKVGHIMLSCPDIIEIAKNCREADLFLIQGDKTLDKTIVTQIDSLWKIKAAP